MSRTFAENACAALGPARLVGQQLAVLLHRRAAAGHVHRDDVDPGALEHLDQRLGAPDRLLLAPGVQPECPAAALLARRHDLVALGGQHPHRREVDLVEEDVLDAAGEHADPATTGADGRGARGGPRERVAHRHRRQQRLHRHEPLEATRQLRQQAVHALRAQLLVQRPAERRGPQPAPVGEQREDRLAEQPVGPRARHVALDLRPGGLQQAVVLHPRRARRHARHAPEAAVDVRREGAVERDLPVLGHLHEVDPPARRVHLLAPQRVGGAGRQAEPAVHAVVEQFLRGRVVGVEAAGPGERLSAAAEDVGALGRGLLAALGAEVGGGARLAGGGLGVGHAEAPVVVVAGRGTQGASRPRPRRWSGSNAAATARSSAAEDGAGPNAGSSTPAGRWRSVDVPPAAANRSCTAATASAVAGTMSVATPVAGEVVTERQADLPVEPGEQRRQARGQHADAQHRAVVGAGVHRGVVRGPGGLGVVGGQLGRVATEGLGEPAGPALDAPGGPFHPREQASAAVARREPLQRGGLHRAVEDAAGGGVDPVGRPRRPRRCARPGGPGAGAAPARRRRRSCPGRRAAAW